MLFFVLFLMGYNMSFNSRMTSIIAKDFFPYVVEVMEIQMTVDFKHKQGFPKIPPNIKEEPAIETVSLRASILMKYTD